MTKTFVAKALRQAGVCACLLLPASSGWSQTENNSIHTALYRVSLDNKDDMSKLKLLAERGYVDAQLKVAKACMDSHLFADALKWYSAAADQGDTEARYEKGHLLLFGRTGGPPEQNLAPAPSAGLRFTCMAATNHHNAACLDLACALRDGTGCLANPIRAYAWFSLCLDAGNRPCQDSLNQLALQFSTEQIREGLDRARALKAGHWPDFAALLSAAAPVTQPVGPVDLQLKLSGVDCSPREKLAVINNHTLGERDSCQLLTVDKKPVTVTCVRICKNFVEVQVEGEPQSRTLVMVQR